MSKTCKNISSRKAKGRNLQKTIKSKLLEHFSDKLEEDDIRSTGMGQPGMDLQLSPLAKKIFPFAVECKNNESLNFWASIAQTESNSTETLKPMLIVKKNRSKIYAVIEFDELLNLLKIKQNDTL